MHTITSRRDLSITPHSWLTCLAIMFSHLQLSRCKSERCPCRSERACLQKGDEIKFEAQTELIKLLRIKIKQTEEMLEAAAGTAPNMGVLLSRGKKNSGCVVPAAGWCDRSPSGGRSSLSDGAPAAAAPWRVMCCSQRGAAAAHARCSWGNPHLTHLRRSAAAARSADDSSSCESESPPGRAGERMPRPSGTFLGLVLAVAFCVGCASAGGPPGGERLWKQVGRGGLDTGPRLLATRGKSSLAVEASGQLGFVPSRALHHRATGASSSRVPPLCARMPQAGSGSRHPRSLPPACRAPRKSLLHMVRGGGEGAPISTVSTSCEARSPLWGNWTEHQVKIATLLWIEKFVIGLKLCPFAVEAMNGLRVHVADATNRDMALDQVDVEIKGIVGLDKALPACTLMVYPPALFEKGQGDASKTSPLCNLDENSNENSGEKFEGFDEEFVIMLQDTSSSNLAFPFRQLY